MVEMLCKIPELSYSFSLSLIFLRAQAQSLSERLRLTVAGLDHQLRTAHQIRMKAVLLVRLCSFCAISPCSCLFIVFSLCGALPPHLRTRSIPTAFDWNVSADLTRDIIRSIKILYGFHLDVFVRIPFKPSPFRCLCSEALISTAFVCRLPHQIPHLAILLWFLVRPQLALQLRAIKFTPARDDECVPQTFTSNRNSLGSDLAQFGSLSSHAYF
jgi:hypothetical protein